MAGNNNNHDDKNKDVFMMAPTEVDDDDDDDSDTASSFSARKEDEAAATEATIPKTLSSIEVIVVLLPQAAVALSAAMTYMVVGPSLIFYVTEARGTITQYGFILSAFSLSAFLFKPVLAYWSDHLGGRFRQPYLVSIAIGGSGGLLYFLADAPCFKPTAVGQEDETATSSSITTAVALIFLSRILAGLACANNTLGFSYIARVMPRQNMTQANAIMTLVKTFGMVLAPALNVMLDKIHGSLFGLMEITNLNGVGLFVMFLNVASYAVIYFFQDEPEPMPTTGARHDQTASTAVKKEEESDGKLGGDQFWRALLREDVMIPLVANLCLYSNFQLFETALAPVASDALGWGPVEISTIFAINAVVAFATIAITFHLAARGVSDETLLVAGLIGSIIGFTLLYLLWFADTSVLLFVLPIFLALPAFPLMSAPVRTLFTKAVDRRPVLQAHQGTCQAIMGMTMSVAGFCAPSLVAILVLRTPEEVAMAFPYHRELSPYALFAPLFAAVTLAGFLHGEYKMKKKDDADSSKNCTTASQSSSRQDSFCSSSGSDDGDIEEPMLICGNSQQPIQEGSRRQPADETTALLSSADG